MKPLPFRLTLIMVILSCYLGFSQTDDRIPGRVIVKFAGDVIDFPEFEKGSLAPSEFAINSESVENTIIAVGATHFERVFKGVPVGKTSVVNKRTGQIHSVPDLSQVYVIHFDETFDLETAVEIFRRLPEVVYVQPDYYVETCDSPPVDDLEFNTQWYLDDPNDHDVNAPEAWEITHGDPNIIIAMVEPGDGAEISHLDLQAKRYGGNYQDGNNEHPTWTSGVAAAHTNNAEGIASLAYNCRFMPRRSGSGLSDLSNEILQSANAGADIINNSWVRREPGGPWWKFWSNWNVLYDAVQTAFFSGSVIVAAMGNASNYPIPFEGLPAAMEIGVISVGGTQQDGNWWQDNGNYGSYIDVSAPAENIRTTNDDAVEPYTDRSGTSYSAPLTSGLAALLLSVNPGLTPDDVEQIIRRSATDVETSGWDQLTGEGRIDARAALDLISPPNSVTHVAVTGGSKVKTVDNAIYSVYRHMFSSIITANYFGDEYKVTKTVTFPTQYVAPPEVWVRISGVDKNGWPPHQPSFSVLAKPYVEVKNLTTTGCTFETYIYDLYDTRIGYIGYVPCQASAVKFDYTVVGVELAPPQITGFTQTPDPIVAGNTGYVYCNAEGSNLQYSWQVLNNTAGATVSFSGNRATVSVPYFESSISNPSPDGPLGPLKDVKLGCTVSNSVGSDYATYDVNIVGAGGCPTLAFNKGDTLINENTLLVSSLNNPGSDVTDFYLINQKLTPENNNIDLVIHEPENEHTWLDQVELIKVRANKNEFIAVTDEGEIISYKKLLNPLKITLNDSLDITHILGEDDSLSYSFKSGDKITIELNKNTQGDGEESYGVISGEEPQKDEKIGYLRQVFNEVEKGNNQRKENGFGNFYLRPIKSSICKNLGLLINNQLEFTFYQPVKLYYFTIVKNKGTAIVENLDLINANHNVNGNVLNNLKNVDMDYAEILPGERINFTLKTHSASKGNIRYILKSTGRYEKGNTKLNKQHSTASKFEKIIPDETELIGNYPNPFNPQTTIKYSLKEDVKVKLVVYNMLGQKVKTLVEKYQSKGYKTIVWDGFDDQNNTVSSGICIYKLIAGDYVQSKKNDTNALMYLNMNSVSVYIYLKLPGFRRQHLIKNFVKNTKFLAVIE